MRHWDWSNPFPFHDELLQVFIPRMYYNYRIENRAYEEPAAILFTSATRKKGHSTSSGRVILGLPSPFPRVCAAGGRTDVRWRQDQNFSDQLVTKFAYPWCSASSAINVTFTDKILKLRSMKYKPLEPSLNNSGPLWSSWKLLLSASFKFSVVLEQNLQFCLI